MTTQPADPSRRRCLLRAMMACGAVPALLAAMRGQGRLGAQPEPDQKPPAAVAGGTIRRVLLEAERFVGDGWRAIAVGEGNYMVDAIGASHVSGGRLLHAEAGAIGAMARAILAVPGAGRYKLWARYEYPYPTYAVPFEITVEQAGSVVFQRTYGLPESIRLWFFRRPDAPWQDFENGVEGLVAEGYVLDLEDGPAEVTIRAVGADVEIADRNLDALLLTDDVGDTFRQRGDRLYPLLDEFGRAAAGRTWVRLTNPPDSGIFARFTVQYTINRSPWRTPILHVGREGLAGGGEAARPLASGEATPWLDLSCLDTTHDGHLQILREGTRGIAVTVEVASAPDDSAILRRLEYAEAEGNRLLLNVPPYPAEEPDRILTGEEVLEALLAGLATSSPPDGRAPARFLVYATMGDGWETGLDARTRIMELSRRLFGALGPSAPTVLRPSQAGPARELMRQLGRETPPSFLYGRYRWFPSDDAIVEAERDLGAAGAGSLLRGFNYGDEVKLDDWLPKDGRDEAFRAWLHAAGAEPRPYLPPGTDTQAGPAALWSTVHLDDDPAHARANPRLYVDSRQFLQDWAIERLASQAANLRATFGDDVIFGANYSPGAYFWPFVAQWVRLFQAGGATRASHDDYWWQVSEMGPESTGYLLDAFRDGLRGRRGAIQPYVMPHSPGNTDRDVVLGLATALIHGATSIDLFNLGPEQSGTENYVSNRDPDRLRTIRDALYQLGAVEDLLLDGSRPRARVGLVLSESTECWELATPGQHAQLSAGLAVPSLVYAQERKFLWQALRHAQIPTDTLIEADLAAGIADDYDVIYMPASHLARDAAEALARWVEAGGTLVSVAGGGLRDPYDDPLEVLLPVFGLRGAGDVERFDTFFRPRVEVPRLAARDSVHLDWPSGPRDLPVLGVRQRLDPLDGRALGRFADGAPAIVEHVYGQGHAILIGALPGLAYFQSGFPDPPPVPDRGPGQHMPLTAFRADLRELIVGWADGVARDWPVSSDPLVEVGQWETATELLIVLANGGAARTRTRVRLAGVGPIATATHLGRGTIAVEQLGEDAILEVDIDMSAYVRLARGCL